MGNTPGLDRGAPLPEPLTRCATPDVDGGRRAREGVGSRSAPIGMEAFDAAADHDDARQSRAGAIRKTEVVARAQCESLSTAQRCGAT